MCSHTRWHLLKAAARRPRGIMGVEVGMDWLLPALTAGKKLQRPSGKFFVCQPVSPREDKSERRRRVSVPVIWFLCRSVSEQKWLNLSWNLTRRCFAHGNVAAMSGRSAIVTSLRYQTFLTGVFLTSVGFYRLISTHISTILDGQLGDKRCQSLVSLSLVFVVVVVVVRVSLASGAENDSHKTTQTSVDQCSSFSGTIVLAFI